MAWSHGSPLNHTHGIAVRRARWWWWKPWWHHHATVTRIGAHRLWHDPLPLGGLQGVWLWLPRGRPVCRAGEACVGPNRRLRRFAEELSVEALQEPPVNVERTVPRRNLFEEGDRLHEEILESISAYILLQERIAVAGREDQKVAPLTLQTLAQLPHAIIKALEIIAGAIR